MKDNGEESNIVNVVVIGDTAVGKTNLIHSYACDTFMIDYQTTVFDHFTCELEFNGHPTSLEIWDLSGKDEHLSLRKFAYSKAQCLILFFSMTDKKTFDSIQTKWLKEIRADEKLKTLPLILVATKCDLLEEHYTTELFKKVDAVVLDQAKEFASQEGFATFI